MNKANQQEVTLVVTKSEDMIKNLNLTDPKEVTAEGADPEMEKLAEDFFTQLMSKDMKTTAKRSAIDQMGLRTQREASHRSKMLDQPIKNLMALGEDGGPVAKSLIDLKVQMEELDPTGLNLDDPGFGVKLLGKLPFFGSALNRYFTKFQKTDTVIAAILQSLKNGGDTLKRDTTTLSGDQEHLSSSLDKLTRAIQLAQLLDQKFSNALETKISDENEYQFVEQELLFPLRQRTQDLQQQLAVTQQGIIAIEILIRNNRELIRGVNRAENVSVTALQVAVTVALGLANQRIVLKQINALNIVTSNQIAGTARLLRQTGTEIHKQASTTMLDMDKLEAAFEDIKAAMDDIATFRSEALPQMASNILRLDELTAEQAKSIERMERGNVAQAEITIDVD